MQLHDLLSNPGLDIRLRTATSGMRLRRPVTTVAPTELIDPSSYLEGNELVTLAGVAMNFQDPRTWGAYVERLADVPIAGIVFNSGVAHQEVPKGLVDAGDTFDIPIFEVAHPVNLLQVHRLVNDTLYAEVTTLLRTSLQLADRCAELEAAGTTVLELLEEIRVVLDGEVGLVDGQGHLVASQPPTMHWEPQASRKSLPENGITEHVRQLNSVRGRGRFSIVVRSSKGACTLDALLGPVGSIVSLHLNSTAEQYTVENDCILALIEQMRQPHGDTIRLTKKLMRKAGFDTSKPTLVVTTRTGPDAHDAWRMRMQFADLFAVLAVAESEDYVFLIGQGFNGDTATKEVVNRLKETAPRRPAVVTAPLPDLQSLRTAMLASPLQLLRVAEPVVGQGFDISSVLATALTAGGVEQALSFLRPLDLYDKTADYELMRTLRAYLDADGSPSKTAATLFIHRNSLLYRLNRISELLGVSLRTLEGKTSCAVALAVWDMQQASTDISGSTPVRT